MAIIIAALAVAPACASNDDIDQENAGIGGLRVGVDYAWARPSPRGLRNAGFTFAARYLSYETSGKNLDRGEADGLIAAGLDIVVVWEQNAGDAAGGFGLGAQHARDAEAQARGLGMPPGRPIYFAIDFDAAPGDQPAIDAYFDGVASVIGRARTGAYGGLWPIRRLFDHGKITYGWQTYAWSGGEWDSRAQLRQVENGILGGDADRDEAWADDFGQWGFVEEGPAPAHPPLPTRCGRIEPGHGLSRGQSWRSCDGRFTLSMQTDGNLVLSSFDVPLWSTGTGGRGDVVIMQGDGNLVLYSTHSHPLFASGTDRHPGATAFIQDDGNFVIYAGGAALWASGPGGMPPSPTRCGAVDPDRGLAAGQSISSCDGTHRLTMQGDGNLVLYNGGAIWWTGTQGSGANHAIMQGDGNLVVYAGGTPVWNSGTPGFFGARLDVQNDGNLVIYQGSTVAWASWTAGR